MLHFLDAQGVAVFGWVGFASSLVMYLTPITVFRAVVVKRDVQKYSSFVYFVSAIQCSLWTFYAIITPGILESMTASACGLGLQVIYCSLFFAYSKGSTRSKFILHLVIAVTIIAMVMLATLFVSPYLRFFKDLDHRKSIQTNFLGCICVFFNLLMNGSPLTVIRTIIQTKSAHFLPIWITMGTLVSSMLWGIYAFGVGDIYILIPCVGGVVLCSIQIGLYVHYGNKPPIDEVLPSSTAKSSNRNESPIQSPTTSGSDDPDQAKPRARPVVVFVGGSGDQS